MPTDINTQNALQIRERPMDVYIHMLAGSTATISSYSVSTYKSYDSTLGNTSWSMRAITDLAGDGFPLDGSCQWYDSSVTPSATNGKLGARSTVGSNMDITVSAGSILASITVASEGVSTITVGGNTYTATGLDVIPINANSATLTFTADDPNGRSYVNYIIPGAEFSITNDNLISCTLALRGNLSAKDHTWEQSEIEIQMYYPNNIGSAFAYINDNFPITYQAGYDSDLSDERKFYLSEAITQENNVITIRGVDASYLLDNRTMSEQWYTSRTGNAHQTLYNKFISEIQSSGITLKRKQSWSGSASGATQYAVLPEMTLRDFVSNVMNLTLNHTRGGTKYAIQFVDAGIPTVEHGNGKTYGKTWSINKSDCGEWAENYEQNIAAIIDTKAERKFAENFGVIWSPGSWEPAILSEAQTGAVNQIFEFDFSGYYYKAQPMWYTGNWKFQTISSTPTRLVLKITSVGNGNFWIEGTPTHITGGATKYSNPNGLTGVSYECEPFVYGNITDGTDAVFNYQSLFNRSIRTGKFTWKGDPRMQPLDYLNITNDTGDGRGNITARVTNIELTHEAGGTVANIEWREWS